MITSHPKVINLAAARVAIEQQKRGTGQEAGHTLTQAMDDFLVAKKAAGRSERTLEFYAYALPVFVEWAASGRVTRMAEVTPAHVRAFLVHLGEKGHNQGGIHTLFTGVRTFLNWYRKEHDLTDWHPLRNVEAPKARTDPLDPLSLEDFRALVETCIPGTFLGDRDRALLMMLLDSGIRWAECAALRIGDVDLASGQVLIRKGKGAKARIVFIGAETAQALTVYLEYRPRKEADDPLWVTGEGGELSKAGVREVKRRAARMAGLPEMGMHAFRRGFAVNTLRAGMSMAHLQRMLGHADLTLIQRYAKLVDTDLAEAHRRYGIVDRLELGGADPLIEEA